MFSIDAEHIHTEHPYDLFPLFITLHNIPIRIKIPIHHTFLRKEKVPRKRDLAILAGSIIFLCAIVYLFIGVLSSPTQATISQRLQELEEEGISTQAYPGSFAEAKADRPDATFHQSSWNTFKQQVEATKADLGFVTVWYHSSEDLMWVARYDLDYYYYILG